MILFETPFFKGNKFFVVQDQSEEISILRISPESTQPLVVEKPFSLKELEKEL